MNRFEGRFPSSLADCYLALYLFEILLSVGGRILRVFFRDFRRVLGLHGVFLPLSDGQLANEILSCLVGLLRTPFLSPFVPGCCAIPNHLQTT